MADVLVSINPYSDIPGLYDIPMPVRWRQSRHPMRVVRLGTPCDRIDGPWLVFLLPSPGSCLSVETTHSCHHQRFSSYYLLKCRWFLATGTLRVGLESVRAKRGCSLPPSFPLCRQLWPPQLLLPPHGKEKNGHNTRIRLYVPGCMVIDNDIIRVTP